MLKNTGALKALHSDATEEAFLFPQRAIQFKEASLSYLFRALFRHKEAFEKPNGSADVKGSLWHREAAALSLRVKKVQERNTGLINRRVITLAGD